jgi:hypothetical protein
MATVQDHTLMSASRGSTVLCAVSRVTALVSFAASAAAAQVPTRDHYTVSAGVLGAANQSAFRVEGPEVYTAKTGWSAGAWLNVPLGFGFSFEPQLQYSAIVSDVSTAGTPRALLDRATANYLSAPVYLKLHIGRVLALSVGGQVDYPISVTDAPNYWTTDSLALISAAATGGVELFPHSRVTLYGRYVYGVTNLNANGTAAGSSKMFNQGIHAGVKMKAIGKRVYADTDGDGIRDAVDKCKKVVGVARFDGCPDAAVDPKR